MLLKPKALKVEAYVWSELTRDYTELNVYVMYGIYPITWTVKSNKL